MKVIIAMGMHSSGTSFVQEGMKQAGAVVTATTLNKNFEEPLVLRLNDEIMKAQGGDWKHPYNGIVTDGVLAELSERIYEIHKERIVRALNGNYPFIAYKDPRFVWTFWLWNAIISKSHGDEIHIIKIERQKEACVKSCQRRWGETLEFWDVLYDRYIDQMRTISEQWEAP